MNFSRCFKASSLLVSLAGLSSLVLTGELNPLLPYTALLLLGACLFLTLTGRSDTAVFRENRAVWNSLTGLWFLFFLGDLLFFSRSLLHASVHLSLLLTMNKFFTLQSSKDHLHLYALSFLQILASSALTTDFSYAGSLLFFLLASTWALLLYHLKTEMERVAEASGQSAGGSEEIISLPFFMTTNGIALASLVFTILIFFLIPRIGSGFFQRPEKRAIRVSGFSDTVVLGTIGPVKLDPTVVMRVVPSDPRIIPSDRLYWRGVTFDYFDGTSWKNRLPRKRTLSRGADGEFLVKERQETGPPLFRQEIYLEPIDAPVLFAASHVTSIAGFFRYLMADTMNSLYLPFTPLSRFQYAASSQVEPLSDPPESSASGGEEKSLALYLERTPGDERIAQLAEEVTRGAKSVSDKAAMIENYLKRNYTYTLDVQPSHDVRPIEDFLFRQKAGYCEQYATAMAVMLKTLHTPSRLVTGFLAGEWNPLGGYYVVRQSDAHAWVEVSLPSSGWMTFDPTPSVSPQARGSLWSRVEQSFDFLRWKWDRYVIGYSLQDQLEAATAVKERTDILRDLAAQWFSSLKRLLGQMAEKISWKIAVATWAVLFFLIALWVWAKRSGGWSAWWTRRRSTSQTVEFYARMLTLLTRRGMVREKHLTPLEFFLKVMATGGEAFRGVETVTRAYYDVRFGGKHLSGEEKGQIEEILRRLKNTKN